MEVSCSVTVYVSTAVLYVYDIAMVPYDYASGSPRVICI